MVTGFEVQYDFWDVHMALDEPRINQPDHEFQSYYIVNPSFALLVNRTWNVHLSLFRVDNGMPPRKFILTILTMQCLLKKLNFNLCNVESKLCLFMVMCFVQVSSHHQD